MPKRALVVDSDFFFVEFISELLEKRGYRVSKAYDGKQGIAGLEAGPFDIVFSDLVLPKVDGKTFFRLVRQKLNGGDCPLVAISGTMIEQMENLDDFSADYFIAKGPLEKLGSQLSDLISGIENHQGPPPQEKRILHTGGVFPRREAIELLQSLEFHRSVIEALGSGVIVLDHDTRVIHANEAAKTILGKSDEEIINGSILALFPKSRISQLVSALKTTARGGEAAHGSFFVGINGRVARAVISSIKAEQAAIGWVVALEGITG